MPNKEILSQNSFAKFAYDFLSKHLDCSEDVSSLIFIGFSILFIIIVALIAKWITRNYLLKLTEKFVSKTKTDWDDILLEAKFFRKVSLLIPAALVFICIDIIPDKGIVSFVQKITSAYIVAIATIIIDSLLTAFGGIYRNFEISKEHPIKTYIQTIKIIVYVLGIIFVISTLIEKDPWGILASLGALTAVIMLIFKDSILGLVASFQLSAQKMVNVGDWIELPKYGADGDVIDISLNTIKVQNWDKTISMIPTHCLISDSFKNWKGMSESGGRRIKRSIYIDTKTIQFCTEEMLNKYSQFEYLNKYISDKEKKLSYFNSMKNVNTENFKINGRHLTNIGCFRKYIKEYLQNHPKIHQGMTLLVRQLQATEKGLPIQIYTFTNDIAWANYEDIQSDIFDHIFAILEEFDLKVYQYPSDMGIINQ